MDTADHSCPSSQANECVVSMFGQFILNTFRMCSSRLLQNQLLCSLNDAGLCCCMPPGIIINALVENLPQQTLVMRNAILSTLNKCLMEYLSGAQDVQEFARSTCLVSSCM